MNDRELRKEFIRVERSEEKVEILVREIRWEGPHTPIHTWAVGKRLPATASKSEIEKATAGILENDGYFRVCPECNEKKPFGWNDGSVCQGCAVANHGVVY
jgi:hypothetical protein